MNKPASKQQEYVEENINQPFRDKNAIIVIRISVIYQGTRPIKFFILSIVLKVFIDFRPRSLLATVEVIIQYQRYF